MLITRQSQDKLNITTGGTERFARTRNKPIPPVASWRTRRNMCNKL